jgi:RNA polymerase sigma-70 factor (ECF subfamily)
VRRLDPETLGDHVTRLYRAAYGLTASRADAEDLVQDTFERVLRRPRFLRREHELAYLLRVLRNTWISSGRGQRAVFVSLEGDETPGGVREDPVVAEVVEAGSKRSRESEECSHKGGME